MGLQDKKPDLKQTLIFKNSASCALMANKIDSHTDICCVQSLPLFMTHCTLENPSHFSEFLLVLTDISSLNILEIPCNVLSYSCIKAFT
jgi:hypothetical protein